MKFESRKDIFFSSVILGISVFLTAIMVSHIVNGKIETEGYWPPILLFSVIALLLWLYFGTNYELSKKDGLIYRSGPFNGKINADRITEVIKGKTLWVGFRPATARKGLIIKYDKYNELYITPKTNEAFINKLLELNKAIKISE
ncbi:PH domain-containing protein [Kriegella aquimaris]|uniref:PH domain-containing protein n=1 Tax=Kriegella aquimaris TaxID=192904 RepID=A0A1G9JBQ3_9FLAO|nr:PH domain-containing protein [Kriegella aquimaris]SDL34645.1 PH domain-containing protein [Kriegella aquimaris]